MYTLDITIPDMRLPAETAVTGLYAFYLTTTESIDYGGQAGGTPYDIFLQDHGDDVVGSSYVATRVPTYATSEDAQWWQNRTGTAEIEVIRDAAGKALSYYLIEGDERTLMTVSDSVCSANGIYCSTGTLGDPMYNHQESALSYEIDRSVSKEYPTEIQVLFAQASEASAGQGNGEEVTP